MTCVGGDRKPSENLRAARALVARGWCQEYMAEDVLGNPISADEFHARWPAKFCIIGACYAVGSVGMNTAERRYLRRVLHIEWEGDWNDVPGRTQTEVLDAFDAAIALAESEGR